MTTSCHALTHIIIIIIITMFWGQRELSPSSTKNTIKRPCSLILDNFWSIQSHYSPKKLTKSARHAWGIFLSLSVSQRLLSPTSTPFLFPSKDMACNYTPQKPPHIIAHEMPVNFWREAQLQGLGEKAPTKVNTLSAQLTFILDEKARKHHGNSRWFALPCNPGSFLLSRIFIEVINTNQSNFQITLEVNVLNFLVPKLVRNLKKIP